MNILKTNSTLEVTPHKMIYVKLYINKTIIHINLYLQFAKYFTRKKSHQ